MTDSYPSESRPPHAGLSLPGKVVSSTPLQSLLDQDLTSEHFQAIVQSCDDAIISKTLDGHVTSWNRGAQMVFGYSAEEMLGKSMLILFPPEREQEEQFILEKILAGEKVDHFETVRLRKDGRLVDVSVTISPIRDEHGAIVGASKIARDITLRKLAEARLLLASNVFTHTNEAIMVTDAQGLIIEVNDAFTRITGYLREDAVGQSPRMFRSGRQGPEVFEAMWHNLVKHGHCQGEVWSRRKDGEAYAGLVTVSVIADSDGQPLQYVAIFADITSLRKNQELLEHVAHFDSLTDLPNRLLLSDRLHQAMVLCKRMQQSLAVLYLDLDGFKSINDCYGHDVGDELLVSISGRMKGVLREVDTLARMGGDEFVVVLVNIGSLSDCVQLVERILQACAVPVHLNGQIMQVSASIGVTLYPQDDAETDQLMRHADRAMYEAKQAGKNRYHLFDPAHDAEVKTKGEQLERIAQALELQEFVLYYQPKVNMRTGAVVGAEALIRWQHPEQGLLAPAAFLPLIEGHPLIEAVGMWVIESALHQMTHWQRAGLHLPVSVNISARQLQGEGFTARLALCLAHFPAIDPADLELEILETSALQDMAAVSAVMDACHRLGVRFAVDDFGTGYSSLTYLKRLPAETLKIDQSFVRDMLDDEEDLAIVQGVIGLAHAFHREVIAEGVETIPHGRRLLELGCEQAQGYGIARPMPSADVPHWVATWQPPAAWRDDTGL